MRKSLEELIETCFAVKTHLCQSGYELHDYEDGAYADILTHVIKEPKTLCSIIGKLTFKIIAEAGVLKIRIFEDFKEYDY